MKDVNLSNAISEREEHEVPIEKVSEQSLKDAVQRLGGNAG